MSAAQKISRLAMGYPEDADAGRLPHARRHVAGLSHRRAAVRHARRHARAARVPVRRRVHADGDADLRRQHVADRLRVGAVRAARDPARRRAARAGRLAGRRTQRSRPTAATAAGAARAAPARHRIGGGGQVRPGSVLRRPRRARRCASASRPRPARTRSARRSSRPTSRRCSTWIKHFMRSTRADRSDARLHVLPARRHDPHRRAVQRDAGEGLAEPAQDLRLHAEDRGRGNRVRAPDHHATWRPTPSGGRRRRPTSTC